MLTANQNPEQLERDAIDKLLGFRVAVQSKKQINLQAAKGIAVREYQTGVGPADYILFINKKPVGLIEAKREEDSVPLIMHEDKAAAESRTRYLKTGRNNQVNHLTGIMAADDKGLNSQPILCRQGRLRTRHFQQAGSGSYAAKKPIQLLI